jgi:uncharacterized protein (TIGR04255 family)
MIRFPGPSEESLCAQAKMAGPSIPRFKAPPLVETILGLEFAPIGQWQIPHFGLYWQKIREEYPTFEVQPPLASSEDRRSTEDRIFKAMMIELHPVPPVRCWYRHAGNECLLQLQNDRFIHNWRKTGEDSNYPHYEGIRPIFEVEWNRFREFLKHEQIGSAEPSRCEVTYVNHLVKGREWNSLADVAAVFPWFSPPTVFDPPRTASAVGFALQYPLAFAEIGHLSIQLQHAVREDDRHEVLQFTLTARGKPSSPETSDLLLFFDSAREAVVRTFTRLTSPAMHDLWQRTD